MKDWRGTPIEVGSRIVYPGRQGTWLWLNEGEVEEFGEVERFGVPFPTLRVRRIRDSGWRDVPEGRLVTLTAVRNVTVVQ